MERGGLGRRGSRLQGGISGTFRGWIEEEEDEDGGVGRGFGIL
jgi:hypothetical protein